MSTEVLGKLFEVIEARLAALEAAVAAPPPPPTVDVDAVVAEATASAAAAVDAAVAGLKTEIASIKQAIKNT